MRTVLAVLLFLCSCGPLSADEHQTEIQALPDAYRQLGQGCLTTASFNCCLSSVREMAKAQAVLYQAEEGCPAGYVDRDMLKCEGSYIWCVPAPSKSEDPSTENVSSFANARDLISKYIHDRNPGVMDWISPFHAQIVKMGPEAVGALLEALKSEDPDYVAWRLPLVYILGEIGDARAYPALRDLLTDGKTGTGKWRIMISLGACLTAETVDDYAAIPAADTTGVSLQLLQEISGQGFGSDPQAWSAYFRDAEHLNTYRENCRKRSQPLLG